MPYAFLHLQEAKMKTFSIVILQNEASVKVMAQASATDSRKNT